NQHSPTIKEIAAHLNVSEEEVIETMEMSRSYKALSVDYKHEVDSDGGAVSILEMIGSNEDDYRQMDIQMLLESVFTALSERERLILHYIFSSHINKQEVGELLVISQMHVSRLQRRSLPKLR